MSKMKHFHLFKELSEHRLEEIIEFLDLIEIVLAKKFQDWGKWYEGKTKGWSDDDKAEFIDFYYDDLMMVRDTSPNMARQAVCVCMSGYFEAFVGDLCRVLHRSIPLAFAPKQRLYLDASKKYLMKIDGFDKINFECKQWMFCVHAHYVRDAIAHYNGQLPWRSQGGLKERINVIKRFVSSTDGIDITSTNRINIERRYCTQVVDNIKQIGRRLILAGEKCLA